MADLKIKNMKDGLPVVLQGRDLLEDGSQVTESWDRLSKTVTVSFYDVDEKFTVLKFTESQYVALINGIRKQNPSI